MILINTTILSLVLVLFLTGKPTNGLWGVNSKLLATLLLWSLLLIESSFEHWSCYLVQIPGYTLLSLFSCVCFPRAYIIISFDPPHDYLLVHIIVEIHLFGILDEWSLSPSSTSSSSPWLMMNYCFETCSYSSFPENLTMSSRQLCYPFSSQASWVWHILTPTRSESRSDMMVGIYFQEL